MSVQNSGLNSDEQLNVSPKIEEKEQLAVSDDSLTDNESAQIVGGLSLLTSDSIVSNSLSKELPNLSGLKGLKVMNTVMCPW